jgi:hypothetical protein
MVRAVSLSIFGKMKQGIAPHFTGAPAREGNWAHERDR